MKILFNGFKWLICAIFPILVWWFMLLLSTYGVDAQYYYIDVVSSFNQVTNDLATFTYSDFSTIIKNVNSVFDSIGAFTPTETGGFLEVVANILNGMFNVLNVICNVIVCSFYLPIWFMRGIFMIFSTLLSPVIAKNYWWASLRNYRFS